MGKQKRRRRRPHKENPTRLMSVKDFDEIENSTKENKESNLQHLYDDIQSCNMKEKLSALYTLEAMAWDAPIACQMAKDGITKLAGPLLLDSEDIIRGTAVAIFRQIALSGDDAFTNLMSDGIMTPLTALLKQYYPNCLSKKENDEDWNLQRDTYVEAVSILWALCDNNDDAIHFVNEQKLVPILIKYLDINIYGISIVLITLQFIITVTVDNSTAIEQIKLSEQSLCEKLINIMTAENTNSNPGMWFVRIASISLLSSIYAWEDICSLAKYFNLFMKTLDEVLTFDNKQLLSSLVSILSQNEKTVESTRNRKKMLDRCQLLLNTQQLSLEILGTLGFNDDEDDENSDADDSEELDESDEMELDDASENLFLPTNFAEALNHYNIISKIWEKTVAMDTDSREILDQTVEGKNVLKQFCIVQCKAYFCLNNILFNFDIDDLGGIDNLYSKWLGIGNAVVNEISPDEKELQEAAVHAMRTIIERLNDMQTDVFTQMSEADFQMILMCDIQTRCTNVSVRGNMIRILGQLALNLSRNLMQTYSMTKKLAEILLNDCLTQTRACLLAKYIDAIMDLFAQDETDRLAADINLTQRLKSLIPIFKNKVKTFSRGECDHSKLD